VKILAIYYSYINTRHESFSLGVKEKIYKLLLSMNRLEFQIGNFFLSLY
jgi:hypothetical protein